MSSARGAAKKDERLDAVFQALADGTRRRIVDRLSRGPVSVSELAEPFSISLAAVSKHLDVLERAGILRRRREGRFQHCHLTPGSLGDASAFIDRYRTFWDDTLEGLALYVEEGT
ncbi:MAG: metalloregulator ArsR/SmtB family transcription factor [Polyangiaceae bacterium]